MVCCWHTRTSNTGTPSMPQTRNCRAQLCCQLVTEEADAAEDLYDSMPKGARWPWEAETIQLKRGPHQCIPGSLRRNRTLSQDLPHHPSKGCPTSCSCPIATWPLVREKLDEWLKEGIITPVEEPTDWVSSLAYSRKANGKLRICLDPKDLNAAIKRDHYKTPTVEEITHELAGSRKFTNLDGTSSYLCIVLDYESSLLTTFNMPWGRYRFIRLPLDSLALRTSFSEWWTRSPSAVKESSESPTMLLYMARMTKSTTDDCTTSCESPVNMDSSSTKRNAMWKPLQSPSLVLSRTRTEPTQTPRR